MSFGIGFIAPSHMLLLSISDSIAFCLSLFYFPFKIILPSISDFIYFSLKQLLLSISDFVYFPLQLLLLSTSCLAGRL